MMRRLLLALAATTMVAAGCGAKEETRGYQKADFESKPVPPGFGPGGPGSGHTGATPPPSATTTG